MSADQKIFDIEIAEGDQVYVARDVVALNETQAIHFARVLFGGLVDEMSAVVHVEERSIH
jgi:hypothetical protein|tara:strand:+ start:164 stop:343 length:180 start_codon:yes stop_codon:yes gene_type:complete